MIRVKQLNYCGVMANYRCTAACRHCLYASSPSWDDGYISEDTALEVGRVLRDYGCRTVHIGGGEPFLHFDGLLTLVKALRHSGVRIDYIETNASWVSDAAETGEKLRQLSRAGADCLCISVDPYHAEYVPVRKPVDLAQVCRETGMDYFLWRQEYLRALLKLDPGQAHSREELEAATSPRYILETARAYGIDIGGRAVNIEEEYGERQPVDKLLSDTPCRHLLATNHFHVDLYGRFIPAGCTGMAIPLGELTEGFSAEQYPAFATLAQAGIGALYRLAQDLGFRPDEDGYTSRCAMCFHIRRWLSGQEGFPELDPVFYRESLAYYR